MNVANVGYIDDFKYSYTTRHITIRVSVIFIELSLRKSTNQTFQPPYTAFFRENLLNFQHIPLNLQLRGLFFGQYLYA